MLDHCAPGYKWRLATHSRVITYKGKTYPSFPKHREIELGHIRRMIRHLGIEQECAKEYLPI